MADPQHAGGRSLCRLKKFRYAVSKHTGLFLFCFFPQNNRHAVLARHHVPQSRSIVQYGLRLQRFYIGGEDIQMIRRTAFPAVGHQIPASAPETVGAVNRLVLEVTVPGRHSAGYVSIPFVG